MTPIGTATCHDSVEIAVLSAFVIIKSCAASAIAASFVAAIRTALVAGTNSNADTQLVNHPIVAVPVGVNVSATGAYSPTGESVLPFDHLYSSKPSQKLKDRKSVV